MYFHNSLIPRGAYFLLPLESKQEATTGGNFTKCISEVKVNQLKVKNMHVKMGTSTFKCLLFMRISIFGWSSLIWLFRTLRATSCLIEKEPGVHKDRVVEFDRGEHVNRWVLSFWILILWKKVLISEFEAYTTKLVISNVLFHHSLHYPTTRTCLMWLYLSVINVYFKFNTMSM